MSAVIHVKLTPKKPPSPGDELPPAYAAALALPSPDAPASPGSRPSSRRQSREFAERVRRSSITEENEIDGETEGGDVVDWDPADEAYSMDDETFEPYDDDPAVDETARDASGAWLPHESAVYGEEEPVATTTTPAGVCISRRVKRRSPRRLVSPRRHWSTKSEPLAVPHETVVTDAPALQYDAQTFSIVSKLRALNRQLTLQLEQQAKHVQRLQDEKRQHLAHIQTLEKDVRTVKQTLKTVQSAVQGGPADRVLVLRSPERRGRPPEDVADGPPPPYASLDDTHSGDRVELPHVGGLGGGGPHPPPPRRRSPRSPPPPEAATTRPATTPCRSTAASPRGRREGSPRLATAPARASSPAASWSPDRAKIEKLEQDKRELLHRHAHQLANYSHELSRLERQVENAQKLVQAKDYELRLQKSRQLYACCNGSDGGGSGAKDLITTSGSGQRHHHHATLLSDALWRELFPSPAAPLSLPSTSHVGLAFEQLLGHQLLSFHDRMVDATTRDWLHEIRRCGAQVLQLHHSFQCMTQTFKALAQCCHIYELAEAFTREVKQLCKAEQAFLFVMDPAENEFWCRVPRPGEGHSMGSTDLITVRSRVMPLAGTGGVSAVSAEHTGTTAQNTALLAAAAAPGGVHVPCGLASWVFHTKKPLLVPAGHVTRHAHYSTAPDNTDRLMAFKSASTLLLPVVQGGTTLGVVQVCGKLTQVAALGVALSLEKCEAFTREDQVVLTMLSHFLGGVLPKAAYFTEVESNKVNEETLIQLAPDIFTCLRFEELGKLVIQNAKQVLDADRCSLFVADNDDRMLYNWQSDISGKGGVEVVTDVKKSTMRVPFGHGIVGMVAETRQLINIPDAYEDPRFNASWDKKTNYRTKSILTVPILSTAHAASKAPLRRRRSQHDVYGAVVTDPSEHSPGDGGINNATPDAAAAPPPQPKQTLLGVVQVINKSGGAPFRSKDEFLLQTISKLIALAIENSQLFQKTQELCASLGKLIADADLAEAVATLSACAEDIIGVESAAVYVLSGDPGAPRDLVTFHRKRRHKIVVKEHMYRHSLLERALRSRELVIANDLSSPASAGFNAYVDSIGGLVARNALFMPLLIDDPEDATQSTKKLVGLLHLVNTRGRKLAFERFDLFLSIVGSQTCSVVASILEKQALLRQQEQTKHLLDTTLSFFKEMSPVGIINAVYNTCASLFGVEKAHLFLWEPDRRAMWTAKLSPGAEQASAAALKTSASSPSVLSTDAASSTTPSGAGGGAAAGHAPSLRAQARRISVLTDQKIRVPTSEGLLEHVLGKGAMVVVKHWVDVISETHGDDHDHDHDHDHEPDTDAATDEAAMTATASVSAPSSIEVSKYALRASRADYKAGFTRHAVVACPVWDIYGQEIVGVVVLLYPKSKAPAPQELGNLPNLSRQISGALNVCGDLRAVTQRCQTVQALAEGFTPRRVPPTASLTLSARGQLVAFSQPLNVATPGFSASALLQYSARTSALGGADPGHALTALDLARLPLDNEGHRWAFALSGVSLQAMTSEHFVNWIGKDVGPSMSTTSHAFDRLRTDLQSVFVRKETVQGELSLPSATPALRSGFELAGGGDGGPKGAGGGGMRGGVAALPKAVVFQLRLLLWEFADAQAWQIDVKRVCRMFDAVDPARSRLVSRANVELALTTHGRSVELDALEWDLVHEAFAADAASDLVDVDRMVRALAPRFKSWPRVAYELIPVLDSITQSVVNVHVLLTALDAT